MNTRRLVCFIVAVAAVAIGCWQLGLSSVAHAQAGGGKKAADPDLPGIPELPPGVELPPEAREQLEKALKDVKAAQDAAKAKQPKTKPTAPDSKTPTKPNTPKTPSRKPRDPSRTPADDSQAPAPKKVWKVPPSAPASTAFKRVAKEQRLGKVGDVDFSKRDNKKPRFWVSPDGRRLAYLIDKGINVDGKDFRYPNSIRQADQFVQHFKFSPDGKRTSWVVQMGGGQGEAKGETLVVDGVPEKIGWNFIANHDGGVFSRDSKHMAYTARRYAKGDVEYVLMVDGKELEVFKKSPAWSLSFSADNKRVIWAEEVDGGYAMRESSVDGKEPRIERAYGPAQLTMNFFYGPAGELGFLASRKNEKFIVYDGKELAPSFKDLKSLLLSRDGKHVACVIEPESFRDVVVVDGKSSPVYGGLGDRYVDNRLTLSPVGGRYAYGISKQRVEYPVVDGKVGKGYARVAEFVFSPDGKRLAHWAVQNGKLLMVVDGGESEAFDELGLPVFSPDGKTMVHRAGIGQRKFIVVDGKQRKDFAGVGEPEFSPDGKRLVYLADLTPQGPTILADTGKEGKQYDAIRETLYFSPGGERLAMVTSGKDRDMVVVDGVEGNQYDHIITLGGGKVAFEGETHWRYLAVKDGEAVLVEETIEK